ncbi:MAG: chromate transporter, partial [Acidaminococcaceae bacterium]|nr:chromate transporter [Acidaminococcaceae bacterium]
LGVSMPSFILVLLVAGSLKRFSSSLAVKSILHGIRPAVIGFLLTAVLIFLKLALFPLLPDSTPGSFHPSGLILICFLFYLHYYRKVAPIPLIMLAGTLGFFFY